MFKFCSSNNGLTVTPKPLTINIVIESKLSVTVSCIMTLAPIGFDCPLCSYSKSETYEKKFCHSLNEKSRLEKIEADIMSAFSLSVVDFFGIHIVVRKPVPGYLLPLGSLFAVIAIGVDGNSSAGQKLAPYLYVCGVHQSNKVVHNYVNAVLVEIAAVSEPEKIQL